jgi:hypothetical protein
MKGTPPVEAGRDRLRRSVRDYRQTTAIKQPTLSGMFKNVRRDIRRQRAQKPLLSMGF